MSYKQIQKANQEKIVFSDKPNMFRLKAVLKFLKGKKGKLLDVGCSDGRIMQYFIQKGFECEGIDISDKAIEFGKRRSLNIKKVDITKKLPFKDETFDITFCGEVLEHLLDPFATVKEMHRVLKKKGSIVITVPNTCMFRNLFLILLGRPLAYSCTYDGPHYRDFCEKEAIRILKSAGFRNIKIKGDKFHIPYWKGRLIRLKPYIARFCDNLILEAKK